MVSMPRRFNTGRQRRRGSTLIEFAFVLIPLLAIVFGAIEVDRLLLVYTSLGNAARAGVRYASVHGFYQDGPINDTTTGNIGQVVKNFAGLGALDASRLTVTQSCSNDTGAYVHVCYEDGNDNIGSRVSVRVSYPYDPFTSFFPSFATLTISSTAKSAIAF